MENLLHACKQMLQIFCTQLYDQRELKSMVTPDEEFVLNGGEQEDGDRLHAGEGQNVDNAQLMTGEKITSVGSTSTLPCSIYRSNATGRACRYPSTSNLSAI